MTIYEGQITDQPAQQLRLNATSYEFDYFSGSQISVYIGDVLVDDIATIQYHVSQRKRPIYGYASQYFHKVASGQVLVEGTFSIPFKESDYLLLALARYSKFMTPVGHGERTEKNNPVLRENIERIIQDDRVRTDDRFKLYRDLSALSDDKFENIAENFEDILWAKDITHNADEFTTPNASHVSPEDYDQYRRADQYPPFSIYILYGDVSNPAANHTIKKIFNCHIIGQGQVIAVGGEPVLEQYSFIARNVG